MISITIYTNAVKELLLWTEPNIWCQYVSVGVQMQILLHIVQAQEVHVWSLPVPVTRLVRNNSVLIRRDFDSMV